jgi:ABC-type polysaccharide/polyol phosphate transport system ATPase subunit
MVSISVKNVTLDIPLVGVTRSLRSEFVARQTGGRITGQKQSSVRALDGVSFDLAPGTRLGLIGHNGAGKSTLLRLLAGVYAPTTGEVTVRGKVVPLFNPSIGMDLDDTGIENIWNIGLLLGMTSKEIRAKTQEIAEFTELGEFLDLPVRTYSSGMLVRLAFAVATSIEPEILLLDEGIGAGDARFAKRAEERVRKLYYRLKILVLASHSEALIKELCDTAAMLEYGKIVAYGPVDRVLDYYRDHIASPRGENIAEELDPLSEAPLIFDPGDARLASPGAGFSCASGVGTRWYWLYRDRISAGRWYWEIHSDNVGTLAGAIASQLTVGVAAAEHGRTVEGFGWRADGMRIQGALRWPWGLPASRDGRSVIMVAADADKKALWFGLDGTWFGRGAPAVGAQPAFNDLPVPFDRVAAVVHGASGTPSATIPPSPAENVYPPPEGFAALPTAPQ